jgi:hypothetical protein
MRKQFRTTFEVFIDDSTGQSIWIDFEQHEIGSSLKSTLQDSLNLVRVGTVDKSFEGESVWYVFA